MFRPQLSWRTRTGCSWRPVPMCWRQRGGSVALRRQTPLSSEPCSSYFCSTETPCSASVCSGFSRFHRLSLGLLELRPFLDRTFVPALHKAHHGPLSAAPCRQKSMKFNPNLCGVDQKAKSSIVGFWTCARDSHRELDSLSL